MLTHLSINNFILIKKLKQNFNKGMTAIIGESGSGKSIILDALSLLIGGRYDNKKSISEGKIDLIAEFDIKENELVLNYLKEKEFYAEDETCILRRVITDGRNKSFINSYPCSIADLKELGSLLIEMHSQHKTTEILSDKVQLEIVDYYAQLNDKVSELSSLSSEYNKKDRELKNLLKMKEEEQSKLQLLSYKYKELEELSLKENEVIELEAERKVLSKAEDIIKNCSSINSLIDNDSDESLMSYVNKIKRHINELDSDDKDFSNMIDLIETISINSDELGTMIGSKLNSVEIDDERLNEIDTRLEKIYTVARKNMVMPENLYMTYLEIEDEFNQLDVNDDCLDQRVSELKELKEKWSVLADEISKIRHEKSEVLGREVTKCLEELKMEGSIFSIFLEKKDDVDVNPIGKDNIIFLLRSNVGHSTQPLNIVASGGELSRISLSLQSIIARFKNTPTIIFDEIDTGIGGTTANVIGKYMQKISNSSQLICITHLPQVAVYANDHISVKKRVQSNETIVDIKSINSHDCITEVARMIGNEILDSQALAQAKKMIEYANEVKRESQHE